MFEQKKDHYKPKRVISGSIIILSLKVMVIQIEAYNWTNILTKLNLT